LTSNLRAIALVANVGPIPDAITRVPPRVHRKSPHQQMTDPSV
jgi:hypothetical protein